MSTWKTHLGVVQEHVGFRGSLFPKEDLVYMDTSLGVVQELVGFRGSLFPKEELVYMDTSLGGCSMQ